MAELYDKTTSTSITPIVESCEKSQEVVKVQQYSPSGKAYIQVIGRPRKSYDVQCSVTRAQKSLLEAAEANGDLIKVVMHHGIYYGFISEQNFSALPEDYFSVDMTLLATGISGPQSLNGVGFENQPLSIDPNNPTMIYRNPDNLPGGATPENWYAYATGETYIDACYAMDTAEIYFGSATEQTVYVKKESDSTWTSVTLVSDSGRGIYDKYLGGSSIIGYTDVIPIYEDETAALNALKTVIL